MKNNRWPFYIGGLLLLGSLAGLLLFSTSVRERLYVVKLVLVNGILNSPQGEKRVLENGSVTWWRAPEDQETYPAALLFHGFNKNGANQRSIHVLRQTLLEAGFGVLAVDHPGFGESPNPSSEASLHKWDPLETDVLAYEELRKNPNVTSIVLVGHSLGCEDVLRVARAQKSADQIILLGAGLNNMDETAAYWHKRFIKDRSISFDLSFERFMEIQNKFYNRPEIVKSLPNDHPPVLFIEFENDFPGLKETRGTFYDFIPGRKSRWMLPGSDHYFNTSDDYGFILPDKKVMRKLSLKWQEIFAAITNTDSPDLLNEAQSGIISDGTHEETRLL